MLNFSGKCVCGHSWDEHHHSMIQNLQALINLGEEFRNINGSLGDECEATQFEGVFTPDVIIESEDGTIEKRHYDKQCNCMIYWDILWENKYE